MQVPSYITPENEQALSDFFIGKPEFTLALFDHFIRQFQQTGTIAVQPAKTMIGISNGHKKIAWVTQLGKNFIHVVFPFEQPYEGNLCFQKIAQVPGDAKQFNHHFRMLHPDDVNTELVSYMQKAYNQEK